MLKQSATLSENLKELTDFLNAERRQISQLTAVESLPPTRDTL